MPRSALAAAACLAGLALGQTAAFADDDAHDDKRPTLSVSGSGKVSAAPDTAEISMGVLSRRATAREALAANSEAMASLLGTLKQRGVASKDIQTIQIQVMPQYSEPPGNPGQRDEFVPRVVGYNVTNLVQVTARDISKLGTVLDAVVQAGANQIHGVWFRINEPEKLLDQARQRAMADAKRKAELLAGEAKMVLGRPRRIEESSGYQEPPVALYAPRLGAAPAAPEAPVSGGEQELNIIVHVVYELNSPK